MHLYGQKTLLELSGTRQRGIFFLSTPSYTVCLFVCLFATNINFIIKVLNKEEKSLKSSRSLPSTGESTHPSFLHGWPRCLS